MNIFEQYVHPPRLLSGTHRSGIPPVRGMRNSRKYLLKSFVDIRGFSARCRLAQTADLSQCNYTLSRARDQFGLENSLTGEVNQGVALGKFRKVTIELTIIQVSIAPELS